MQSARFRSIGKRGPGSRALRGARHSRASVCLSLSLSLLISLAATPTRPAPPPAADTSSMSATSTGAVRGFVIDAETRRPIAGARVSVEQDGAFAAAGPTVGQTNASGQYSARARIGRSWNKIDWVRALTSFWPMLLLKPQSAQKQSRVILATRLNLRVERDGYRPFVGEVRCARMDPGKFAVNLDDIWLAPAASDLVSSSPDRVRYERVESFTVEPAIAHPGDRVTITAKIRIPYERGGRYRVYFDSSEPKLIKTEQELKEAGKPEPATGISTFQKVVTLPRQPRVRITELSPWIALDYREIPVGWDFKTLLQVVRDEKEAAAAGRVREGYEQLANHNPGLAAEALSRAAQSVPDYAPACRFLGEAYEEAGRTAEAATAYKQLVTLLPEDLDYACSRYAEALLDSGQTDDAAKVLADAAKRSKKLPANISLARARLFARRGDLRAADEQLASAGRGGRIPRPVQQELNLKRAEAALHAAPDNPDAELAMARALADLDRLEEAERHARRAQELRPDEPWPLIELAGLERRQGRPDVAKAALTRALALDPKNSDAHFALGELLLGTGDSASAKEQFRVTAERRPYDFAARHGLGLAELRAGDRAAALEALRSAAVIGRGKGEMDAGLEVPFGFFQALYFGPKRVSVKGFSRQEAADDFQLAQALERLQRRPDDALAQFNAGTALVRLNQPDLALESLDRAAVRQPELADLRFWRAVALIGLHRADEARAELEQTLKQNPMHRHAHRILARLCLDAGQVEQAQAHLAAHRRNWPNELEREPDELEAQP